MQDEREVTVVWRDLGSPKADHYDDDDAPPASWLADEWEWDDDEGDEGDDDEGDEGDGKAHRYALQIQFGSEHLWSMVAGLSADQPIHAQVRAAALEFRRVLECWTLTGRAPATDAIRVTRIDLCADAILPQPFQRDESDHWRGQPIKRTARGIYPIHQGTTGSPDQVEDHQSQGSFSGWSFGKTPLMVRVYDKTREIVAASQKHWFKDLWDEAAPGVEFGVRVADGQTPVWRCEAQIRRDAARALGIARLCDAAPVQNLRRAWVTVTTDWLTLTLPTDGHTRRDRTATDPRWQTYRDAWGAAAPARYGARIPERDVERTARAAAGSLASYAVAIQTPDAERSLQRLAKDADALERYDEAISERLAEQVGLITARSTSLARAIGRAMLATMRADAIPLDTAAADLAKRMNRQGKLQRIFEEQLARILAKRYD